MTQDEIIRMAREAGMEFVTTNSYSTRNKDVTHLYQNMYGIEKMERFAALVAAHEREACAKIAERFEPDEKCNYVKYASTAIRARGKK